LCNYYELSPKQVIAIGDGANDLEMMKIAGLSVAYQGKPILKKSCNIQINFGGLDCLIDFFDKS
jgi:phosphoserine phosphatase